MARKMPCCLENALRPFNHSASCAANQDYESEHAKAQRAAKRTIAKLTPEERAAIREIFSGLQ